MTDSQSLYLYEELLAELVEVKSSQSTPEQYKHQDWSQGFELLLNVLGSATLSTQEPVCCKDATLLCLKKLHLETTALKGPSVSLHMLVGFTLRPSKLRWLPAGGAACCVSARGSKLLCMWQLQHCQDAW